MAALIADWTDSREKERTNPQPRYSPAANGWENGNIGQFLEAAYAWSGGYDDSPRDDVFPEAPSWNAFADFLYAGKVYE